LNSYSSEKWWVSPFNFKAKYPNAPSQVVFHDVTLRDGEQTPGVVFNADDKLEIARILSGLGVRRIEAGMPVISDEERSAIRSIVKEGLDSEIFTLCRLRKEDIEASAESEVQGIVLEAPVGVPKLKQFGWGLDYVESLSLEMVDLAKSHGLYVTYFGVDTTRVDEEAYFRLMEKIVKSKADAFAVVDTFGCITTDGMRYLVRKLREITQKPIEVHTHNDLGLAVANTVAAVLEGASVVHTAVNGLGERVGNAAFEEVAVNLEIMLGIKTGITLDKLKQLSQIVEERSGFRMPPNKPIVGDNAFARESGISVAGWAKYNLGSEPLLPEVVGNQHRVLVGKKSGRHAIEYKLKELGITANLNDDQLKELLAEVKHFAELNKRALTDEEFTRLVAKVSRTQAKRGSTN
jgi:isopropylmalate/homocitrate/citramalate synthase